MMKLLLAIVLLFALADHVSAGNSPCIAAVQGFIQIRDTTGALTTTVTPIAFPNPLRTFRQQTDQGYHGATCLSEIRVNLAVDNSTGVPKPFTFPFIDQGQFEHWRNLLFQGLYTTVGVVYAIILLLWLWRHFALTVENEPTVDKYCLTAAYLQGGIMTIGGGIFMIFLFRNVEAVQGHFTDSGNLYCLAYLGQTMVCMFMGMIIFTTQVTPNMLPIKNAESKGPHYLSPLGTPEITKPLVIAGWISWGILTFITAEGHEDTVTKWHYVASLMFFLTAYVSIIQMAFFHIKDKKKRGIKYTEGTRLALAVTACFLLSQKNSGWVYGWFNLADSSEYIFAWVMLPAVIIGFLLGVMALNMIVRLAANGKHETPINDEEESDTRNTTAGLVASAAQSQDSDHHAKKHSRSKTPDGKSPEKKKKKAAKYVDSGSSLFND